MNQEECEEPLTRAAEAGVAAPDVDHIRAIFESYEYVTELIEQKNQTLGRLRSPLFGSRTESRANVLGRVSRIDDGQRERSEGHRSSPGQRRLTPSR